MPEQQDQQHSTPDSRRASIRRDRPADQPRTEARERYGRQEAPGTVPDSGGVENDLERRRRRAVFLRELNEAKALRERVQPRRARAARMRQAMRMRTFRW
ncbi:MAG TPA: hypothetical protein VE546_12215 [Streptomyces sp.]|uniref:hypothetical protein n=1 Tax=Streptomyces sp. TaxID=1931 RepID=UPI002D366666|nr:hypothetical protein [Streptomyces sp.]HZG04320.1 hypothetical protein [Streptomyces sp.]